MVYADTQRKLANLERLKKLLHKENPDLKVNEICRKYGITTERLKKIDITYDYKGNILPVRKKLPLKPLRAKPMIRIQHQKIISDDIKPHFYDKNDSIDKSSKSLSKDKNDILALKIHPTYGVKFLIGKEVVNGPEYVDNPLNTKSTMTFQKYKELCYIKDSDEFVENDSKKSFVSGSRNNLIADLQTKVSKTSIDNMISTDALKIFKKYYRHKHLKSMATNSLKRNLVVFGEQLRESLPIDNDHTIRRSASIAPVKQKIKKEYNKNITKRFKNLLTKCRTNSKLPQPPLGYTIGHGLIINKF